VPLRRNVPIIITLECTRHVTHVAMKFTHDYT
jgi:hypothetical protein